MKQSNSTLTTFEKIKRARNRGDFAAFFMLLPSLFFLFVITIYPFAWLFKYVCYEYNGLTARLTVLVNAFSILFLLKSRNVI